MRVVAVFIDELDLDTSGFAGVVPEATRRPSYHPTVLLKIYVYGCLNRVQSSRRLERKAGRNIELMWLTGRLAPDFKTIADFRRNNAPAIRAVCSQFVALCRRLKMFTNAVGAIDGSKFKAVNNRDKNYTVAKVARRMEQVDASIACYLAVLDRADREDSDLPEARASRIREEVADKGATAVIPNNSLRTFKHPLDKHLYAQRHLVECCFSKLKKFRRFATRIEKTVRTYRAIITLAAIVLWLR